MSFPTDECAALSPKSQNKLSGLLEFYSKIPLDPITVRLIEKELLSVFLMILYCLMIITRIIITAGRILVNLPNY